MTTTQNSETALLATGSSPLAMGLAALLLSIPPIRNVELVADVDALEESLTAMQPILVVLDTNLIGPHISQVLQTLRGKSPQALRIILSKNMTEFRELNSAALETVVITGADPARLARTIEYLLNHRQLA